MTVTVLTDEVDSTTKVTNDEGNSSNTKTGALIHIVIGRGGGESVKKCSKIQADKYELGLG